MKDSQALLDAIRDGLRLFTWQRRDRMDREDLKRALDDGRYEALLDRYREKAMSMGINAIPAHIVGQRYLLVGAHPYEAFIEVLDKLRADESPTVASVHRSASTGQTH